MPNTRKRSKVTPEVIKDNNGPIDKVLTQEQSDSIASVIFFLKENWVVYNPVQWKRNGLKLNYVVALVPLIWGIMKAFGHDFNLTAEQATTLFQAALVLIPIANNTLLSTTSRNIDINPLHKYENKNVVTRSIHNPNSVNDSDEY